MSIKQIEKLKADYEELLLHPRLLGPARVAEVLRYITEINSILATVKR